MKRFLLIFLLTSYMSFMYSQSLSLKFSANYRCEYEILDSVLIQNVSRNCYTTIYYPDTVLTLFLTNTPNIDYSNSFYILSYPNPFENECYLEIIVSHVDWYNIEIFDMAGRLILSTRYYLFEGRNFFRLSGCNSQDYILLVKSSRSVYYNIISHRCNSINEELSIKFLKNNEILKIERLNNSFDFSLGDQLCYTGYITNQYNNVFSHTLCDVPLQNTDYVFQFLNSIPQDPQFVVGSATNCSNGYDVYEVQFQQDVYYHWSVPSGWSIISGQGSNIIGVTVGNNSGTVTVYAENSCGTSNVASMFVNVIDVPDSPIQSNHVSTQNEITWNWLPSNNASVYYVNTIPDINTAITCLQTSYVQSNLNCNQNYQLYVWASNTCGVSQPSVFTFNTQQCPSCVDVCIAGDSSQLGVCALWDNVNQTWFNTINDGVGNLHNRARKYQYYLRKKLMPYGGIFRTIFTDSTYQIVQNYSGKRDAAIWTGIYLAAEAFRYAVTNSPEASLQIENSVRTLNLWWSISGNPGYLARYVAPANCPPQVQNIFEPSSDFENHLNFLYNGQLWNWKGNVSRDQYQGVLFGYSIAYEVTTNDTIKELIRSKIVEFVEQLMSVQTKTIKFIINGIPITKTMNIQYAVYNSHESPTGDPTITITLNPFEQTEQGMLTFWPNPSIYIRQLPGFSWVPDYWMRSQIIQLASAFVLALRVTEGVPAYASRRQAILNHYLANVNDWINKASGWTNTNDCGDSYHGLNIVMIPMYNWVRLENDPSRKLQLQNTVFKNRLWNAVQDHKNVFFAYLFASQADPNYDVSSIIALHNQQLAQFPISPYMSRPVDNSALYPENPNCPGLSSIAIDVQHRVPAGFIWEKNPWKLTDPGTPNFMMPGLDFLIAYWMGRYYGYINDDAPNTCLKWKPNSK